MTMALSHRGPDDAGEILLEKGSVGLGHRRLSIIDLSAAGRQPMTNEDQSIWVVFNGEIYNFQNLRRELERLGHVFRSKTDTEVLLHSYEQWGVEAVKRLRGIFAFALYDGNRSRLWLARDPIGVKPLFYYNDGRRFLFSSELKGILADPNVSRVPNYQAVSDYLAYGYIPFDRCIFENMWKLPAGHYLLLDKRSVSIEQYWDVEYHGEITDKDVGIEQLRVALQEAISLQLVSDVPLGVFLSGGIDSSAITAIMSRQHGDIIRTFTIGFDGYSETPYAKRVASLLRTKHHERILNYELARQMIPLYSQIYDEPFFDSSGLPTSLISQFARTHVKVVLAGDGGDELFAGYKRYDRFYERVGLESPSFVQQALGQLLWRPARRLNTYSSRFGTYASSLRRYVRDPIEAYFRQVGFLDRQAQGSILTRSILDQTSEDTFWLIRKFWRDDYPRISAAQYLDLKTYLVDDILTKVDRASMAYGLEVRVPLLDHKLVELAFRIHVNLQYANQERKSLFKAALQDSLPSDVLSPRKKGFSVPINQWFADGLGGFAIKTLSQGSLMSRSIIHPTAIQQFLSTASPIRVWLLLALELWARRWLDGEDELDIFQDTVFGGSPEEVVKICE